MPARGSPVLARVNRTPCHIAFSRALSYMLEGEVHYRHGDKLYPVPPGDSLFFDADAPHGPEVLVRLPARYLSIISYPDKARGKR